MVLADWAVFAGMSTLCQIAWRALTVCILVGVGLQPSKHVQILGRKSVVQRMLYVAVAGCAHGGGHIAVVEMRHQALRGRPVLNE